MMAMNFSSCSVCPTPVRATDNDLALAIWHQGLATDNDLALAIWHRGLDGGYGGTPFFPADRASAGFFDYTREADGDTFYDPVELLPSDPFGMDLSTTFTAALAGWIGNFQAGPANYGAESDDIFAELSYYCNRSLTAESSSGWEYEPWMEAGLLRFLIYDAQFLQELCGDEAAFSGGEGGAPHEGLFYAIGYLGIRELLNVEMVCRSLRSAVHDDTILWRCIRINSPLSEKITDDVLLRLMRRAQGGLQCLSLVDCPRITDAGLKHVLECNPKLKKLGVPGCVRLSVDGIINNLKAFKSAGVLVIRHLKLGRLFSVSSEQYEDLKILVGGEDIQQSKARKPRFYHDCLSSPFSCDDERAIDIELCPICQKFKLVFDCPSESCQLKGPDHCRACDVCIGRCIQCGRCISNCKYIETFCLQYVCSDCLEGRAP